MANLAIFLENACKEAKLLDDERSRRQNEIQELLNENTDTNGKLKSSASTRICDAAFCKGY